MPDRNTARAVVDLAWRVNRIELTGEEANRYLAELPRRVVELSIRERIARVRCPVHMKRARLLVACGPNGELEFGVSACCSQLEKHVGLVLKYRPGSGEASFGLN